jgi:AraC-like DNA-binding protein
MRSITLTEIQAAIEARLRGRFHGSAPFLIAGALSCSESTLHRTLRRYDTTFAFVRNRIRIVIAIELLEAGRPVEFVALQVDVTPDYLRRLIVPEVGLTPLQIARAATLAQQLTEPPQTLAELNQRRVAEFRLEAILGDLPAQHPLANWAKDLFQRTYLPEIETAEFFAELRRRHREDRAARRDESELRELENGLVAAGPPTPLPPVDEELERIHRAVKYAGWRRRLQYYRRLGPK